MKSILNLVALFSIVFTNFVLCTAPVLAKSGSFSRYGYLKGLCFGALVGVAVYIVAILMKPNDGKKIKNLANALGYGTLLAIGGGYFFIVEEAENQAQSINAQVEGLTRPRRQKTKWIKVKEDPSWYKGQSLAALKENYKTKLVVEAPSKIKENITIGSGVMVKYYKSKGRKLFSLIIMPKKDGKVRPAVMFAHGGDALGTEDIKTVAPFVHAGFIVMLPAWRGENQNPGFQEMCYGEVDDAIAAIDYLSSKSSVDQNRIYAAGHSIGGTIAMLVAESCDKVKKVATCGAYPDMYQFGPYPDAPFKKDDEKELFLRSPMRHISSLKCPLLLIYGGRGKAERLYFQQAKNMKKMAEKSGKKIDVINFGGYDHFHALDKAIPDMITFFNN